MGCSPSSLAYNDFEPPPPSSALRSDSLLNGDRPRPELQIIDFLKQEYNDNFELFVVNNLLLSVLFFENFDEDIKVLHPNSEREIEISKLNEQLMKDYQKRIFLPDTLHEKVNRNIRFQRPHGRDKGKTESFLPERLFIVDENVEISHVDEDAYYSIDKNTFRAALIESENVGFVKLRQMDRESPASSSKSSTDSLGNDIYLDPQPSTSQQADFIESNYADLASARTKEPLVISMDRSLYSTIPRRCIIPVPLIKKEREYDDNESNYVVRKTTVINEHYISSKEMARYFIQVEFPRRIGPLMNFTPDEIQNAEKMLATIYLQSNRSGYTVNYEVTTVLDIQFPKFCTVQWLLRKPKQVLDSVNRIIYEWPSDMQKDLIRSYKCVVIPRGCLQKYSVNKQRSLEWEIAYPRVEKYLQTTMSHAQIKTYFLLILLHKSFIEPATKHLGIISDHIKMVMYWEFERDFINWPETRMGRKLRQILLRLEDSLSRRRQQHYFHHHKNIFSNIPDAHLYEAQTIINKIIQNPVPYVISALRNIKFINPSAFYPEFDYEELYHQLKGDDIVAKAVVKPPVDRRITFNKHDKRSVLKRQDSIDAIDLKLPIKIGRFEMVRRRNILVMFIKHFIEIGKQSSMRLVTSQAQLYFQHATDLTTILEQESPIYRAEVSAFVRLIESEQTRVKSAATEDCTDPMESPALPLRVSMARPTSTTA